MKTLTQTLVIAAALAAAGSSMFITSANAGGHGRQVFIEEYNFKKPMHGYSGHAGNYYCDYQRIPQRKCDSNGMNCKIVGWTLREICQ